MKIGICGLGLIGGSLAKAYKRANVEVLGYDINTSVTDYAVMAKIIDKPLTNETVCECDYIFVALYPQAVVNYIRSIAPFVRKGTVVVDLCGTKMNVCPECFDIAAEYGFDFVGGHPMAGTQFSGFKYSRASMYKDASMILVPPADAEPLLLAKVEKMLSPCRFGRMTVTTAENHDRMIAFSSQMAHVVSNAFVKSPSARQHKGYSAGSYKDMTRVAWLNETMWAELFLENKDFLLGELDVLMENLAMYRAALADSDEPRMKELLKEGRLIKEEVDKVDYRSR
jgi:prephenate dehydrogenase